MPTPNPTQVVAQLKQYLPAEKMNTLLDNLLVWRYNICPDDPDLLLVTQHEDDVSDTMYEVLEIVNECLSENGIQELDNGEEFELCECLYEHMRNELCERILVLRNDFEKLFNDNPKYDPTTPLAVELKPLLDKIPNELWDIIFDKMIINQLYYSTFGHSFGQENGVLSNTFTGRSDDDSRLGQLFIDEVIQRMEDEIIEVVPDFHSTLVPTEEYLELIADINHELYVGHTHIPLTPLAGEFIKWANCDPDGRTLARLDVIYDLIKEGKI